jgi:microcystin degradation protein MlrC
MRVGIVGFLHESNTFIRQPTTYRHFQENTLLRGEAVRDYFCRSYHEIGGFFQGLDRWALEAVPIFVARTLPSGMIAAEAFETIVEQLIGETRSAGRLDGLLVAPHGATVSEEFPDADGEWLTRLRQAVGAALPIVGTLDPHGNLSPAMVAACDALVAYRSNPHLDQHARGLEAAALLARTLRAEIRPTMAAAYPPMAINIERQCTTEPHCRALYAEADRWLGQPGVLSNSVMLGFPYADVCEMGSSFITVTDNDPALADRASHALASYLWKHRAEFVGQFVTVEAAIAEALQGPGPVCLLDMGDNVGGGSPGDGTQIAQALTRLSDVRCFVCLTDPQSVTAAGAAGVGARLPMRLGGKSDDMHGAPVEGLFTVRSLTDGKFEEPEPRHGGFSKCDQGATAIVTSDSGLTVMLTSLRMPPFSIRQLTAFGINPGDFQILVAKGVNAPVAAYAPVCSKLLRVNTSGSTTADMRQLNYLHRRRPLYPLETDFEWPEA